MWLCRVPVVENRPVGRTAVPLCAEPGVQEEWTEVVLSVGMHACADMYYIAKLFFVAELTLVHIRGSYTV